MALDSQSIEGLINESRALCKEQRYSKALAKLADAADITRETHGEMSLEMADVLLRYGGVALDLALEQTAVLGKDSGPVQQAENAGHAEDSPDEGDKQKERNPTIILSDAESDGSNESDVSEAEGDEENKSIADPSNPKNEEEKEESTFGQAWEALEVARAIYQKLDNGYARRRLADVHVMLGDIKLEEEDVAEAISEFRAALNLRTNTELDEPVKPRSLAEIHYKLAIALEFGPVEGQSEALQMTRAAIGHVQSQIEQLQDEKGSEAEAESSELRELLLDMAAKVEELSDPSFFGSSAAQVKEAALNLMKESATLKSGSGALNVGASVVKSAAPVNDLSSLVRKKKSAAMDEKENTCNRTAEVKFSGKHAAEIESERPAKRGKFESGERS